MHQLCGMGWSHGVWTDWFTFRNGETVFVRHKKLDEGYKLPIRLISLVILLSQIIKEILSDHGCKFLIGFDLCHKREGQCGNAEVMLLIYVLKEKRPKGLKIHQIGLEATLFDSVDILALYEGLNDCSLGLLSLVHQEEMKAVLPPPKQSINPATLLFAPPQSINPWPPYQPISCPSPSW